METVTPPKRKTRTQRTRPGKKRELLLLRLRDCSRGNATSSGPHCFRVLRPGSCLAVCEPTLSGQTPSIQEVKTFPLNFRLGGQEMREANRRQNRNLNHSCYHESAHENVHEGAHENLHKSGYKNVHKNAHFLCVILTNASTRVLTRELMAAHEHVHEKGWFVVHLICFHRFCAMARAN